ncbi:DNA-binding MarR family transcriptional regulator [Microbacterium sp. AG790]|uniref:MarR family winged helix-turn-helix transcriptional regulator n=1 Tax=Microbacterium sp. AG790 TaxID=2183995 RepID=UPI000EAB832B|nr:MarR family transcriptional regulator [Microbacterium sp. AG790]RKS89294.1 DNA-binding MarR family transcriptional regulator [Microbacterium sp. AG790]
MASVFPWGEKWGSDLSDGYRHRTALAQDVFEIVRMLESHDLGEALAAAAGYPLTWLQVRAFWFIGAAPGLSQRQLAERLGQSAPTTSKLVSRLADLGFLRVGRDPGDHRAQQIHLSTRGDAVVAAIYGAGDGLIEAATSRLTSDTRAHLDTAVSALRDALGAVVDQKDLTG